MKQSDTIHAVISALTPEYAFDRIVRILNEHLTSAEMAILNRWEEHFAMVVALDDPH